VHPAHEDVIRQPDIEAQRNRASELREGGREQLLSVIQRCGKPHLVRVAGGVPASEMRRGTQLDRRAFRPKVEPWFGTHTATLA
jgi:hypothetical protein